jgi:RimJ/RimL family protein N-acetyltransferase/mannose-6-phosphate isomerase-like protein (cupin superfamily)
MSSADPGQPVGFAVDGWKPRQHPPRTAMFGRWCRVEPIDVDRHAADLYEAMSENADGRNWTYLSSAPPADAGSYRAWLRQFEGDDPMMHAIVDVQTGKAAGLAAYLRIDKANGVIEAGHIHFAPRLMRTPAATEAMYLMMIRAFDELGYRRYEWKCDSLNARSRAAAVRLGFHFEGVFRQAMVYKGRNRDTAWFSIIDRDWPERRAELERWLDPDNFDVSGKQRTRLRAGRTDACLPITIEEKFSKFSAHFRPHGIARMNDYDFKLVRAEGDFVWHSHDNTDETFLVIEGELAIDLREGRVTLRSGDMFVVPKGTEHKPYASSECKLMLIERSGTPNTGDAPAGPRTAPDDVWI